MKPNTFENRMNNLTTALIQEEARIANQLTQQHPEITRTEALIQAKRMLERSGAWQL